VAVPGTVARLAGTHGTAARRRGGVRVSVRLAVVMSGFPRRSETFGLNELQALREAGMLAAIFATKSGDGLPAHAGTERLLPFLHELAPAPPAVQAQVVAERLAGTRVDALHGYF